MTSRLCITATLLTLALSLSCSGRGWARIDMDELREMMPEYSLLSAYLDQENTPDSLRQQIYANFLQRRGYSLADWDSSLSWYARHDIMLFHDLYRGASDSMERWERELKRRQEGQWGLSAYKRDRLAGSILGANMLDFGRSYYSAGELINLRFELTSSTPRDSTHYLELSTSLYTDSLAPLFMELMLSYADSSSVRQVLTLSAVGEQRLKLPIKAGKELQALSGSLRGKAVQGLLLDSLRLVCREHAGEENQSIEQPLEESFEPLEADNV